MNQILMAITLASISGVSRICRIATFSGDGLVKALLKLNKAINEDAIFATLKGLGQKGSRKLQAFLLTRNAGWLRESGLKSITLDADSTVKSVCGNQEGAAKGYNTTKKGAKSYHPLLVFVSEMKLLYHTWFRTGSAYTSNGIVGFLQEVKASLPATIKKVFFRADSGFFSGELFDLLESFVWDYLVKVKLKNLEKLLQQQTWVPVEGNKDIALMIVVNTPGTGADLYPYLVHAKWFGFTLADLVFPSFLFAMGNAMSFSMRKLKLSSPGFVWKKILRRTFLIFFFGYLMYWFPFFSHGLDGLELKPFSETRVMGVLQRIALCYFFVSVIFYYFSDKIALIISGGLLLGYWGILYLFGQPGAELEMASNAVGRFDLSILGLGHIYKRDSIPFDPEGILSTLPAIVNVIGGYLAGIFIQKKGKSFEGIAKLLIVGFLLFALAQWWNLIFPISKKLWTSPFVLYTVGLDLSIMAILIYAIEMKKVRVGVEFFDIFGKNPLFIYLFSELFYIVLRLIPAGSGLDVFSWVSEEIFQSVVPGPFGSLVTALAFVLLCWSLGWWLNKKRIYIKI